MSIHVSNANGEWTTSGIFFTAFGLLLVVTVAVSILKFAKDR